LINSSTPFSSYATTTATKILNTKLETILVRQNPDDHPVYATTILELRMSRKTPFQAHGF
jgi:hypothetical protein